MGRPSSKVAHCKKKAAEVKSWTLNDHESFG